MQARDEGLAVGVPRPGTLTAARTPDARRAGSQAALGPARGASGGTRGSRRAAPTPLRARCSALGTLV
jgi:hypothetical protein